MTRTVRNALLPEDGTGTGVLEAALKVPAETPGRTGDLGGTATTAQFPYEALARGGAHSTV